MKLFILLCLLFLSATGLPTEAESTDIMGGGTPGRSDKSRTSKLMYQEEGPLKNKEAQLQQKERIRQNQEAKARKRKHMYQKD